MNRQLIFGATAALLSSCIYASTAFAGFIVPASPAWTRPTTALQAGSSLTTYQEWDGFDTSQSPGSPNSANNPSSINPNGTPTAFDSSSPSDGAFFVGTDIYSFSGAITPEVIIPEYTETGQELNVTAEVQYYGQDINLNDLLVTYINADNVQQTVQADTLANYSVTNLFSALSNVGFGEADQADYVWTFTVPNTSTLQLDWGWDVTSSALQDVAVDTQSVPIPAAVPEPASVWMGLIGLAAVAMMKCGPRLIRA